MWELQFSKATETEGIGQSLHNATHARPSRNTINFSYLLSMSIFTAVCYLQDAEKLLQCNRGNVVTAYSAFQRLAQKSGPPGTPVADPPAKLPPIPGNAAAALLTVNLKEDVVPSLTDLGYTDKPTTVFKVSYSRC